MLNFIANIQLDYFVIGLKFINCATTNYLNMSLLASTEGALHVLPRSDVTEKGGPEGLFGSCLYHLYELELKTLYE